MFLFAALRGEVGLLSLNSGMDVISLWVAELKPVSVDGATKRRVTDVPGVLRVDFCTHMKFHLVYYSAG